MRKILFHLLLIACISFTAKAQITIDGTMTDWNNVPILSEPGVFPMAKTVNDGTNLNYMVQLESDKTFDPNAWNGIEIYLDADNSSATGLKSTWLYINSGNDYYVSGTELYKHNGAAGTDSWDWGDPIGVAAKGISTDAKSAEGKVSIAELTGTTLGTVYGIALPHYYSTDVNTVIHFPLNNWDFAQRKSFTVKSRTEVGLATTADFISANAYYHPFMKDENIAQYLDFQSAAWATQNPLHWASWAFDLASPGVYDFKMTSNASGSGKVQLSIVNMATNMVVKTFAEVWYPADATMTENSYSTIDLSDVPTGKYMLKLMNPTTWDTFLKVEKVTLSKVATAVNSIDEEKITVKTTGNKLEISSIELMDISIYNTRGQQVAIENQIKKATFDLNNNIYIVKINQNGSVYSKKIVLK